MVQQAFRGPTLRHSIGWRYVYDEDVMPAASPRPHWPAIHHPKEIQILGGLSRPHHDHVCSHTVFIYRVYRGCRVSGWLWDVCM